MRIVCFLKHFRNMFVLYCAIKENLVGINWNILLNDTHTNHSNSWNLRGLVSLISANPMSFFSKVHKKGSFWSLTLSRTQLLTYTTNVAICGQFFSEICQFFLARSVELRPPTSLWHLILGQLQLQELYQDVTIDDGEYGSSYHQTF